MPSFLAKNERLRLLLVAYLCGDSMLVLILPSLIDVRMAHCVSSVIILFLVCIIPHCKY